MSASDSLRRQNPLHSKAQMWMRPLAYLVFLMIFFPLVVYLPTHLLLRRLIGSP